jgi:hypothetical protein
MPNSSLKVFKLHIALKKCIYMNPLADILLIALGSMILCGLCG